MLALRTKDGLELGPSPPPAPPTHSSHRRLLLISADLERCALRLSLGHCGRPQMTWAVSRILVRMKAALLAPSSVASAELCALWAAARAPDIDIVIATADLQPAFFYFAARALRTHIRPFRNSHAGPASRTHLSRY